MHALCNDARTHRRAKRRRSSVHSFVIYLPAHSKDVPPSLFLFLPERRELRRYAQTNNRLHSLLLYSRKDLYKESWQQLEGKIALQYSTLFFFASSDFNNDDEMNQKISSPSFGNRLLFFFNRKLFSIITTQCHIFISFHFLRLFFFFHFFYCLFKSEQKRLFLFNSCAWKKRKKIGGKSFFCEEWKCINVLQMCRRNRTSGFNFLCVEKIAGWKWKERERQKKGKPRGNCPRIVTKKDTPGHATPRLILSRDSLTAFFLLGFFVYGHK